MSTKTITVTDLQTLLTRQPQAAVVDVRTPLEFDEVHTAAARSVPLDQLAPDSLGVAKDQPVYLMCRSGKRADAAAQKLLAAGYAEPVVITGGMLAWIEAGLPVERGTSKVISLERQVRIGAGALVLLGILLARFVWWPFIWLPAFVGAGLIFAGITDWCGMGLLLAKAPWNQKKQA